MVKLFPANVNCCESVSDVRYPNAAICAEPLIVPAGIDVPGIVIVLPLLIVRSLPSMDSV